MKKLFILTMALVCGVMCTDVMARKPKKVDPVQARIDSLKQVKELRAIEEELRQDSINRVRQRELDEMKHANKVASMESKYAMEGKLEGGVQLLITPCMDEFIALNKEPDHMAAQGISTGQPTQEAAELNANKVALADITTRFLGVIKNGIEHYAKDTSTPDKQRKVEAQLEGIAVAVGEKEINKLYAVECRQFGKDRYQNYVCYEALYVPVSKVVDAIVDEAVKNVDIDKAMFRKRLQEELDSNAAKERDSLDRQRAELE